MSSSCSGLSEKLLDCVEASRCVNDKGLSIRECLKSREHLDEECKSLMTAFYDCRRGQIDRRARIKGNRGY